MRSTRSAHLLSSRADALSPPDLSAGTPGRRSTRRPASDAAWPLVAYQRARHAAVDHARRRSSVRRATRAARLISAPGSPSAPSTPLTSVVATCRSTLSPWRLILVARGRLDCCGARRKTLYCCSTMARPRRCTRSPCVCGRAHGGLRRVDRLAHVATASHTLYQPPELFTRKRRCATRKLWRCWRRSTIRQPPRHCRCSASGAQVEQLGALDDSCEGWDGVGAAYWRALFALGGDHTGRKRPDAIVVNFALHYASSETMCDGDYAAHWMFRAASLRKAFGDGAVVWHTGLATQFSDDQRVQGGSVGKSSVGHGWPREARTIDPLWSCRSNDRLWHMFDLAWPVAKRFGFHMLDGITVTAPWPHGTSDNRHYDGGINNEARQLGSITILNELLNLLSSAVKRPLRLTTGSID